MEQEEEEVEEIDTMTEHGAGEEDDFRKTNMGEQGKCPLALEEKL